MPIFCQLYDNYHDSNLIVIRPTFPVCLIIQLLVDRIPTNIAQKFFMIQGYVLDAQMVNHSGSLFLICCLIVDYYTNR